MATQSTRFTKDEFLTARQLVSKLDKKYDIQTIKAAMATEYRKGTKIKDGPISRDLIIKPRKTHHAGMYHLHPLGFEIFANILAKGK